MLHRHGTHSWLVMLHSILYNIVEYSLINIQVYKGVMAPEVVNLYLNVIISLCLYHLSVYFECFMAK